MKENWFIPQKHSGWSKTMTASKRREAILKTHKKALSAARSLMALSNVTQDKETKRLARIDAKYFFEIHKRAKK